MAKTSYICQSCGAIASKWAGQCGACKQWNTLSEERALFKGRPSLAGIADEIVSLESLTGEEQTAYPRLTSHVGEFDRVCGGGLVPGSVILIGGDPGIGKSTLLLQIAALMAQHQTNVIYISGEEATHQIGMRASRLGLAHIPLLLLHTHDADACMSMLESRADIHVAIIDSIQTLASPSVEAPLGSVAQMRHVTQELVRIAKARHMVLIIVGHVTKEGQLAGPKMIEHMVDSVFYFESEYKGHFRILRAVKNRFGATHEMGVFEMRETGLVGIENPSQFFLANHLQGQESIGSAIFASMEGTRPILVEVQTLLAKSSLAMPRRTVMGIDTGKLAMIIAVLETMCGLRLGLFDIYVNIAGGLKVMEPGVDLAIAGGILSSYKKASMPSKTVFFGEIGLSGAVRNVSAPLIRLKEAEKLGFRRAIIPSACGVNYEGTSSSLRLESLENVRTLAAALQLSV